MILCGETGQPCAKPSYWCSDLCDLKARRERKEPMNPTEQDLSELRRVAELVALLRRVDASFTTEAVQRTCASAADALQSAQQRADTLEAALNEIAAFARAKPGGDPGSYQRGYDIGFNNAGLVAAGIAQAALKAKE